MTDLALPPTARPAAGRRSAPVRRLAAGFTVLTLGAVLAACSSEAGSTPAADGGGLTEIVVNYEPTAAFITLKLAHDQGIFEKHGLAVELLSGGPGSSAMSSLLNGQIHVSPAALASALLAADEGLPVVVASNLNNDAETEQGPTYATVAADGSGIESFADLEGKTVAVHSTTCCWVEFTRAVVDAEGGDSSSIDFLPVPFPNQMQALRDGEVDAMTSVQPFLTIASAAGATVLGPTSRLALGVDAPPGAVAVMSRAFAAENPEVVEAWQRAMAEAAEYAEANPEETRALISEETGMEMELLERLPLPAYSATFEQSAYEATVEFMDEYGAISVDNLPSVEEFLLPGVTG